MNSIVEMKKRGYRITKPRLEILKSLTSHPLSAQEIFEVLQKKSVHLDLASVYRTLELLVNMSLVYVIDLGEDKRRYELADPKNHHHHIICNTCGTIEDIQIQETHFLKEVYAKSTFKIDHHHLEFFGICNNCQ